MLDQKEIDAIKAAYMRVCKNYPRSMHLDNLQKLMEECQKDGKRVTEGSAAETFARLMNEGRLKICTNVEEIRKLLNEPQNWRYANQTVAFENEMVRRFHESPDLTNVRDFLDYLVTHGELPENPAWLEEQDRKRSVHKKLKEEHGDYEVDMDAARIAIESECRKQHLPFTFENAEFVFQKLIKDGFIKHTPAWHQAQAQARESEKMIAEITGYMLGPDGKVKFEYQREYKGKVAGLRSLPFADLVSRYETVMVARAQRKAPVEELRTVVKSDATRQRQALHQRYEQIPDLYYPPGKSEGLPWSVQLFKRLPSMEQRRLLDHFGNDQLTAACAAKGN